MRARARVHGGTKGREREKKKERNGIVSHKTKVDRFAYPKGLAKKTRILRLASCRRTSLHLLPLSPACIHTYVHTSTYACVRQKSTRDRGWPVSQPRSSPPESIIGGLCATSSLCPLHPECVLVARAWCSSRALTG